MTISTNSQPHRLTDESAREDFLNQPHLLMKLAENALTVAESLRDNYFSNTAGFVSTLRRSMAESASGKRQDPILKVCPIENADWAALQGEVVTFIDGGVGRVQIASRAPILLRVGSYCVRTGERHLSEREQFGYYPVILGDLEGGSKERRDFVDIVRITAELLGGLSALQRNPDLRVLLFHGPFLNLVGRYAGHSPFTEHDIDLLLHQYAPDPEVAGQLKDEFLYEAKLHVYPMIFAGQAREMIQQQLFEPLAWLAFLYRKLIAEAASRDPAPIIAAVVERGSSREFCEHVLLPRVYFGLTMKDKEDYFNNLYGRSDLNSPKDLLDRLGYTDTLLLAMLLQPGQYSEPWAMRKVQGLKRGSIRLPGTSWEGIADWSFLASSREYGFPRVRGAYVHVSETTEPIRVEVFDALGPNQMEEAARRAYMYARLLPGYSFPVGLDIADRYARVPNWMTEAYSKLIRHHLGVSLQLGEISDAEMRNILVQAIYMTHRDWLFRPES